MIQWAVRETNLVIDPSYGDGVFLKKIAIRVKNPSEQIYGNRVEESGYDKSQPSSHRHTPS
jgi:hypothetical protein